MITVRAVRPDGPPSVCGNQKKAHTHTKKRFSKCYKCQIVDDGISYRVAHIFTGFVDQQIISHGSNIWGRKLYSLVRSHRINLTSKCELQVEKTLTPIKNSVRFVHNFFNVQGLYSHGLRCVHAEPDLCCKRMYKFLTWLCNVLIENCSC